MDRHTDVQRETIIPHHYRVAGYNNLKKKKKLVVLGFNNMSALVGHFVLSPRKREKSDRKGDSRRDEREGQGRKRNRNKSEETEEIEAFPLYPFLLQG